MGRRAVFLDRDGVINRRRLLLVRRPGQLEILPGAVEAMVRLHRAGYVVVLATNQPAVAWGLLRPEDLAAMHDRLRREVEAAGGVIERIEVCPHAPNADCACRKPRPGMLRAAAAALDLDLPSSWMVGDQRKDLEAGRAAACRTILVNPTLRARLGGASKLADGVVPDLSGAARVILGASSG